MAAVALHAGPDTGSATRLVPVTVAAMGTALLVGLAFAALVRRRSRPYLLLVVAFTALLGRSVVAGVSVFGLFSPTTHHRFEHGMDVRPVALVVAAVYCARPVGHEGSGA
jgi:fumarate reductase subunit D